MAARLQLLRPVHGALQVWRDAAAIIGHLARTLYRALAQCEEVLHVACHEVGGP